MSEFTKGKWTYDAKKGFITSDGYTIITVCYPETKEAQSIGRLIAAAPDMYDELYDVLQLLMGKTSYDGDEFSQQAKSIQELFDSIDGGNNHEE